MGTSPSIPSSSSESPCLLGRGQRHSEQEAMTRKESMQHLQPHTFPSSILSPGPCRSLQEGWNWLLADESFSSCASDGLVPAELNETMSLACCALLLCTGYKNKGRT